MNEPAGPSVTPRDAQNMKCYVGLTALWALVFAASTFVLAMAHLEPGLLRWLIALVPSVFGGFAACAYWRYLRGMDELLRMIEFKALALSAMAGFVVWPAIYLVEIGVPMDIHLPVTFLVMLGFYVYGVVKGRIEHS